MNPIIKLCNWIDALPAEAFIVGMMAAALAWMLIDDILTMRKGKP